MFVANLNPGHGFQKFTLYKKGEAGFTPSGRPKKDKPEETYTEFNGALVEASQKEIDQWKQNGHPISHKIIEYSAQEKVQPGEYLIMDDGRQFYVQGHKNPGALNLTMIYYVEERFDVKKKPISI